MKHLLTTLLALTFANQAFACSQSDPAAESRLVRMFQVDGASLDWVSVKIKRDVATDEVTLLRNRSFPVTVEASRRISSSRIIYKRDVYNLDEAKICMQDNKILIVHEEGEMLVSRSGTSLGSAEIRLQRTNGGLRLRLRPQSLL